MPDKKAQRESRRAHKARKQLFVDFGRFKSPYQFGYEDGQFTIVSITQAEHDRLARKGLHPDAEGHYARMPFATRLRHWMILRMIGVDRAAAQDGWFYGWSYHEAEEMWEHYGEDGPTNTPQAQALAMEVLDSEGNPVRVVPGPGDVTYYYTVTGRLKARS